MKKLILLLLGLFLTGAAGTQVNNVLLTKDGGLAVRMVAEENLTLGELVQVGTGTGKVVKAAIDSDAPIGVVFESVSANADVWVVVSGWAYVLPNAADTPTIGYIIYSSETTAGRVSQSNSLPANQAKHNREAGHWMQTCAQGIACLANLHWN